MAKEEKHLHDDARFGPLGNFWVSKDFGALQLEPVLWWRLFSVNFLYFIVRNDYSNFFMEDS